MKNKIFIGIPSSRTHQGFLTSLSDFIDEIKDEYEFKVIEVKGLKIYEARNFIVDKFLESGYSYLLFLDDDHTGHKKGMLDALLKPDAFVCAIKCYTRNFPHMPNLLHYSGYNYPARYKTMFEKSGYHNCDLVGFGMTLIKRELFDIIERPFFAPVEFDFKEDNYFCDKLISHGINPVGCFDYTLTHDGIDESNVAVLNETKIKEVKDYFKKNRPDIYSENMVIVG